MPLTPLQYLTINDFSPGVWCPGVSFATQGGPFSQAPIGAAEEDHTFGCVGLPGGGLGPLPSSQFVGGGSNTLAIPAVGGTFKWGSNTLQVAGIEVFGNVITQVGQSSILTPEIHIGLTWVNGANQERFKWLYYALSAATTGWVTAADKTEAGFVGNFNISTPHIFSTALSYSTTGFPQPIMAACWVGGGFAGGTPSLLEGNHYRWWMPNPAGIAAPNETASANYIGMGMFYAHQSRVLAFRCASQNHILATTINRHNNEIDYTDPPLTTTMTTPGTVLSAETAEGFGAVGSVSSGELFLVKKRGGALIMYDDIVYPRVVRLPGVTSTGMLGQRGSFSSVGMVYAVDGSGMFAWDGSSASVNISPQLRPNFFMPTSPNAAVAPVGTLTYDTWISHTPWMEYVVVANGWVFDASKGSWWQLKNTASDGMYTSHGPLLFGVSQFGDGGTIRIWDARIPDTDYTWGSHAVTPSPGKKVTIREVECVFSVGSTAGVVQVTVLDDSLNATVLSFAPTVATRPWRETQKLPTPVTTEQVKIRISADSHSTTLGAPIVHSVSIGYTEDRQAVSPWT